MKKKIVYKRFFLSLTIVLLAIMSFQYLKYVEIAKTTVPFMDFWRWIAVFGEKVENGTITFWDYFNSDVGEHIQPIAMAIDFTILKWTDFDVTPLVVIGAVLQIMIAVIMVVYFWFTFKESRTLDYIVKLVAGVTLFLGVINLNQWEISTEPFSIAFAYRLANYYLSFIWADHWLANIENKSLKNNLVHGFIFGCYCAFLTVFVGAAYFIGHIFGIGLACLWVLLQKKKEWKQYFFPMLMWGVVSFVAVLVYLYLLSQRGAQASVIPDVNIFILLLQGICLFWGAVFIPTVTSNQYGGEIVVITGVIVLIVATTVLVRYLQHRRDGKGMFPVICYLYAVSISAAITIGRIGSFSIDVMSSSRYVVESSIGLFGVVWMAYELWVNRTSSAEKGVLPLGVIALSFLLLMQAGKVQTEFSPYMNSYFMELESKMRNIDDCSDEDLVGFQANNPDDVRFCVNFFEKNRLSIFKFTNE